MKKTKKVFILSLIPISLVVAFASAFSSVNSRYITNNKSTNNTNQKARNLEKADSIRYTIGDIVDSYGGGFHSHEINKIVIAMPSDQSVSVPNLDKVFVNMEISESNVKITNTYGAQKDLWDSEISLDNFGTQPTFTKPDLEIQENNFMRISEYNAASGIAGANVRVWDDKNKDPANIQGNLGLNNKNSWLLQFRIRAKSKVDRRARIYLQLVTMDGPRWIMPNGVAQVSYGAYTINQLSVIELFFVKEDNKVKCYVPKQGLATDIGTWELPKENDMWKEYKNLPIDLAFKRLKENPNEVKELVDWYPNLVLPSMADFPITLNPNYQASRLEFNYGTNSDFKYVFYVSQKANFHIYPYMFQIDGPPVPGEYVNIKDSFENYKRGVSIIEGFSKGTYLSPDDWIFDKNRYPSQVSITEIKNQVISHIVNPPDNLTLDDILFNSEDGKPNPRYDNRTGELEFTVTLRRALGNDGTIENNKVIKPTQIITGFKKINPTKAIISELKLGNDNILANDETPESIAQHVVNNKQKIFNSLAIDVGGDELTTNDIKVVIDKTQNTPDANNSTGFVEATITLTKNFLREPDALISSPGETYQFKLKITGYKTIKSTVFKNPVNSKLNTELASEQNDTSIRSLIAQNVGSFFENLPDNFDANSEDSLTINRIIEANNMGDPTIDGGNSGYLKVSITVIDYYDSDGNPAKNKTYDLVIYGFKLTGKTEIKTDVVLKGYSNKLVTDVIENEESVKKIIKENEKEFFGNSFLPTDYYDFMSVVIHRKTNTNAQMQLQIDLILDKYYNNNGELVTSGINGVPSLSKRVNISGFRVITPTKLNPGDYSVNDKYSSLLPTNVSDDLIKEIIFKPKESLVEGEIISGDKPVGFSAQNIILEQVDKNNKLGHIEISLNINLRYENNDVGNITTEFFPIPTKIKLINFQTSKPTVVVPTNPLIITKDYPLLASTNVGIIEAIVNNDQVNNPEINVEEIRTQLKHFLWTKAFDGYKEKPFNVSQIELLGVIATSNLEGSIEIEFALTRYMDEDGIIHDENLIAQKKIIGFKRVIPTEVNVNGSPFLVPQDKYGSYKVDEIIESNLLAEVIYDHDYNNNIQSKDRIIIGDIPNNFDYKTNLIITNVKPDSVASIITLDLTFDLYYNATDGSVTQGNPPPAKTIVLRGFEKLPLTTINGIAVTPEYIYPTKDSNFAKPINIAISNNSPVSTYNANTFIDIMNSQSDNTIELAELYLKTLFDYINDYYFYDKTNKPLIVMNPKVNWELRIDSIVVKSINEYDGSVVFTSKISGYYFYQSSQPIKITNNEGLSYAFMDMKVTGFKPLMTYNKLAESLIFILPVSFGSSIILLFLIFTILFVSRKHKSSISITGDVSNKTSFFDDC